MGVREAGRAPCAMSESQTGAQPARAARWRAALPCTSARDRASRTSASSVNLKIIFHSTSAELVHAIISADRPDRFVAVMDAPAESRCTMGDDGVLGSCAARCIANMSACSHTRSQHVHGPVKEQSCENRTGGRAMHGHHAVAGGAGGWGEEGAPHGVAVVVGDVDVAAAGVEGLDHLGRHRRVAVENRHVERRVARERLHEPRSMTHMHCTCEAVACAEACGLAN